VFQQRSAAFLFQRLGGRRIRGTVGDVGFDGGQTDRTGHFSATVEIEASRLSAADGAACPWVGTSAWLDDEDEDESEGVANPGEATGVVQLVTERGLSVISDIDDTVKITNVANRRELLANTFVRDFVPVPGMEAVFRRWQEEASAFHYVSASPWQLSEFLAGFLRAEGLPAGSLHLKLFRLKDSTPLGRFPSRKRSKRRAIEQIMADFPARRFLLVGDSGERDPEVYASIARRQPDRVTGVVIRRVPGPHLPSPKRFARLERRLPPGLIRFFTDADELTGPAPVGGATDSMLR
jgi:phosphatidate phosphatase APP1